MKTYLRILSYAKPWGKYIPQYVVFTLLGIIFGLINFTLLIPLFEVLFNQVSSDEKQSMLQYPEFTFTIDYVVSLFNYYFLGIVQEYGREGALIFVCVIIVVSVFLANVFRYIADVVLTLVRANVIKKLRMDIFNKVTNLHIGFFSDERKGDVMSRITNDVQEVETSVVNTLKVVFKDPATIIGYFAVLFTMSTQLTLFTLILLPVSGIIISEIIKRLKKQAIESQFSLGRLVNILDETLSGIRIVKAFNAVDFIRNKFSREVDYYADVNVSMGRKNALASPVSEFLGVTVVAGILLYGGMLVLNNESALQPSAFISYIIIFSQILTPAKSISKAFSNIQRGLASGERIFSTIDITPVIEDRREAKDIETFKERIIFDDVTFAYANNQEPVLSNINFKLQKGKTIALVGPSGGGKSTIADLIPRFYDPTEGRVLLDGHPLWDYKTHSIRQLMGIVTQESILFNDTIFNNIAFGDAKADEEDVINAAKIANAHDFIMENQQGYHTNIGERGMKISGGQRQRLSIARAVLKNPPILILDEATSALDSASEKLVQEALSNLMKNRTTVVIAHRLSTIQHADEILVIQKGRIIERGKHNQLIHQNGVYRQLTTMQNV